MSNSNTNHQSHSSISPWLHDGNYCLHSLWVASEKGDLIITQSSSSFVLLIINSFDSLASPSRAPHSRMMDLSWVRSHSSFIRLFILSNTIEWQYSNALLFNWMEMRKGRLERVNDFSFLPTPPWITIDSTDLEICCIWLILHIQNTDGWRDNMCLEGIT